MRCRAAFTAVAVCAACSAGNDEPVVQKSSLPPGAVALVGDEAVASATVARIVEQQGLAPSDALARATTDATLALGAQAVSPAGVISSVRRSAAARALLEHLGAEAALAGPPTDAEIRELVAERWTELDRPDGVRVTHAVILNDDAQRASAARVVAERLLLAVRTATSAEEFTTRAKSIAADGFQLRVEPLPPVTADGRTFEAAEHGFVALPSRFDQTFARAANGLRQPGELSPIVESAFGLHVIRLEARIAGHQVNLTELPALMATEVQTRRSVRRRRELLEKLRSSVTVQFERSIDELTARVRTSP